MDEQRLRTIQKILTICLCVLALVVVGSVSYYVYLSMRPQQEIEEEQPVEQAGLADETTFLPDHCDLYTEMPDISFLDIEGKEIKVSDFRGQNLVITFWASWCPDCHEQMEIMQQCKEIVDNQDDTTYILIDKLDHEKETEEQALQYLKDHNITVPTYFDDGLKAYDMLGMHNVPTTFFIDSQGILKAWSGIQIKKPSVFESYLSDCLNGSDVMTQQFINTGITDEAGGIHSVYEPNSVQSTMESSVLSESQGAMLEYAYLKGNKELFDQTWKYIEDNMWTDGMISWQTTAGQPDRVNALIDDLRVYHALEEAEVLWGGYGQILANYRENIKKYGIQDDCYYDFYDFKNKEKAKRFTLCYGDLKTMKQLAEEDSDLQAAYDHTSEIITKGFISNDFPLYYSWYNYAKERYEMTDLNTSEAMVTALHLAEVGNLSHITVEWIRQQLNGNGIKARYNVAGEVVSGYNYESTAVYALVAMIGREIGDDEITGKALKKMEKMRINDTALSYNGAFGNEDGSGITSFDQIMPMLAYTYCEK